MSSQLELELAEQPEALARLLERQIRERRASSRALLRRPDVRTS